MSFPFLMLENIDDCWLEMRDNKQDLGEFNNMTVQYGICSMNTLQGKIILVKHITTKSMVK